MSDNEEYGNDTNYGIDDEYSKSFGGGGDGFMNEDTSKEDEGDFEEDVTDYVVPKFDKSVNKSLKEHLADAEKQCEEEDMCDLDDLINLLENEHEDVIGPPVTKPKATATAKSKKIAKNDKPKISEKESSESVIRELNTGIRLIKSNFNSDTEIQGRLTQSYGKFYQLSDLNRYMSLLKGVPDASWYTIGIIGTKSGTKCSAKGNNYIIWQMHDLNNLERDNEVSLFLFGNSYKTHWKTNVFDVFAIIKPDFMDDNKSNWNNAPKLGNKYFADGRANVKIAAKSTAGQNKNAAAANKITLSVRNDMQLIHLGTAKDIGSCQSYKRKNVGSGESKKMEATQRCKNLVNTSEVQYCIYHCKQLSKVTGGGGGGGNGGASKSFSGAKGSGKFGGGSFGGSNYNSSGNFGGAKSTFPMANTKILNHPNKIAKLGDDTEPSESKGYGKFFMDKIRENVIKHASKTPTTPKLTKSQEVDKFKEIKRLKDETVLSLNYNQFESEALASITFKGSKASDKELIANLIDQRLDKEDVIKYRNEMMATTRPHQTTYNEANKEIKNLFNAKNLVINTAANVTNSISSQKLLELRNQAHLPNAATTVKSDKTLAAMQSHRDIVKEIKKTAKENVEEPKESNSSIEIVSKEQQQQQQQLQPKKTNELHVASFLKQHVNDLKKEKPSLNSPQFKPQTPKLAVPTKFDLELLDDSGKVTRKRLMPGTLSTDLTPQQIQKSQQQKRKAAEQDPTEQTASPSTQNEEKAKRLKLVQDLLNIKSTHCKDANDPEKNQHLKAYLHRLEEKESVENKLCGLKNQTVKVVTCNTCEYTTFKQSDLCKSKRHDIVYRSVLQRYFKCKNCNKRTFTLDKLCPVSACVQCGSEKYEQCGMKDDTASQKRLNHEEMSIDGN